jgi:hypothetical protein
MATISPRLNCCTQLQQRQSRIFFHSSKSKKCAAAESAASSSGIGNFAKENPFLFQLVIATTKTSGADLMVQTVVERKKCNEIDWTRNGIFVVFGFAYLGGFQYWIMVNKYRQWFPTMDRFGKLPLKEKLKDIPGMIDAAKMVLFDVFVHLPWMYFPSYYFCKEIVSGTTYNPIDWATNGIAKYTKNMKEDLTAMIKLWGPADCVQFMLPVHIRMPFRHIVSFGWTAFISFTRGAVDPDPVKEVVVVNKIQRRLSIAD